MKKKSLTSDQECVDLLLQETEGNFELVEEILGIQFATVTGEFVPCFPDQDASDYEKVDRLLTQEITLDLWRKLHIDVMPTSYPCVAVFKFENSFDRTGLHSIQLLKFVYPADFA